MGYTSVRDKTYPKELTRRLHYTPLHLNLYHFFSHLNPFPKMSSRVQDHVNDVVAKRLVVAGINGVLNDSKQYKRMTTIDKVAAYGANHQVYGDAFERASQIEPDEAVEMYSNNSPGETVTPPTTMHPDFTVVGGVQGSWIPTRSDPSMRQKLNPTAKLLRRSINSEMNGTDLRDTTKRYVRIIFSLYPAA